MLHVSRLTLDLHANNGSARKSFNSCMMYTQFGYYVVVMYAMAMHKGIVTGTFNKDTVTPEFLQSMLKPLVGDLSYGECLAPGQMAFNVKVVGSHV